MNKNDLVAKVCELNSHLTKSKVTAIIDSFVAIVTKELSGKGEVRLIGFGTFATTKRKATTGRNPQTGAAIKIPAATHPKFRAGKALKEAVNKKK